MLLLLCALASAEPDVPGASDHPLIQRYEGSYLLGYNQQSYASVPMPLGPVVRSGTTWTLPQQETVSGRATRLLYVAPVDRSPVEVYTNYVDALASAGFRALYACADESCGSKTALASQILYPRSRALDNKGQVSQLALSSPSDQHLFVGRLDRPEGAVYVSVYVAKENFANWKDLTWNRALTLIDLVETRPMETGKVVVDASALARDLSSQGRVALYGLYFESGKATLTAESDPMLSQVATLLAQSPGLQLYVVGHTDDVGGLDQNLDLSRRRAEAVRAALVSRYQVDPSRLVAQGVGPLAPLAPNSSEAGKAQNRRVELVPR